MCLVLVSWCFPAFSDETLECKTETTTVLVQELAAAPLPVRMEPRTLTSGRVPHVQIDVDPIDEINDVLMRVAFDLPGVEKRPTIVSLPGATGMWLNDDVPVVKPKSIVSGREFAHLHTDGSLHAPFTFLRALELSEKGWGERHPWADQRDGWEGLVMLYSARNKAELNTLIQLIAESYGFVTGRNIPTPVC